MGTDTSTADRNRRNVLKLWSMENIIVMEELTPMVMRSVQRLRLMINTWNWVNQYGSVSHRKSVTVAMATQSKPEILLRGESMRLTDIIRFQISKQNGVTGDLHNDSSMWLESALTWIWRVAGLASFSGSPTRAINIRALTCPEEEQAEQTCLLLH